MNQRTYLGTTYLDIAKGAVEIFMKLRARDPASRGDRYMLVTFDEPPYGVKNTSHMTVQTTLFNTHASNITLLPETVIKLPVRCTYSNDFLISTGYTPSE
ncbi:Integrator complex subunit 6 [Acipenser ruthenus]|uniref:Integrator complex subunit 6 n=1 Tax=Acipenser ruthenus TaxID=7906 RepID=A0A444UY63_ACIRT|nr:Integrator complex subunit 6 [Acipenser ruthenus]